MVLANPPHMPVLVLFALTCSTRFYRKKQPSGLEILISTPARQHKEAFDLYQRQRLAINPDKVVKLYPWQQQALEFIRKPSIVKSFGLKVHVATKGKLGFRTMYKA